MDIEQRKLILHFLQMLDSTWELALGHTINPLFRNFFDRDGLLEMVKWLHTHYSDDFLVNKTDQELLGFMGSEKNILLYLIHQMEMGIVSTVTLSPEEVNNAFDGFGLGAHYLRYKPSMEWDEYDKANYYSLLFKHGKVKKAYVVVEAKENGHAVSTHSEFFFDTEEEANEEMTQLYEQGDYPWDKLKVISLWRLQ